MDLGLDEDTLQEEVDLPMPGGMKPRDYQVRAHDAFTEAKKTYSRILIVKATGTGKTVLFSRITQEEVQKGGRVLILAHTEELLDQASEKLKLATGLDSEREKAEEFAGLSASVVMASIQTISKDDRLLAFPDNHFSLVIVDECHRSLARSYMKVMCYFHFGEASLDDAWVMPEPGEAYKHKALILGVTATDDRGDRRSLGQFYQTCAFEYGLIDACRDGYLVRPIVKQLPLKIDVKGVRVRGNDFDAHDIDERLTPLLMEIARQISLEARTRKTIIWLPSVDSARRLSEALQAFGMNANFVSGACPDRAEKVEAFRLAGPGSVMCNAMLLTEGVDIADVNCCCMLRLTKIRSLAVQAYGRGTRVLPGVIDGLETKEERIAAIAASAKPNMLILDFLWLTDRLDLVKPVDLVTTRADMKERMGSLSKPAEVVDLLDLEGVATRDLLKSLEDAARKTANRAARVLDPLAWAVDLGDERLATYQPETEFDRRPAQKGQLQFLERQRIDITKVTCFGHAQAIIGRILARYKLKLATPHQLHFLHQLGLPADKASMLSEKEASATIEILKKDAEARRAAR